VELFAFDQAYVQRLRDGDPRTVQHFVTYFGEFLQIKLRARMMASEVIDDLRQETFVRVLKKLREEGAIRQPESLGAYVNSICNNVLKEFFRSSSRSQPLEDDHLEIPDKLIDLEGMLVSKQSKEHVRSILKDLPDRDRYFLQAIFLEEKEKDEVCREYGVDREYLRVILHRAKERFKVLYKKDFGDTTKRMRSKET
jgi:RNA polymerase sigma-70 factor, ECF subfamily